MVVSLHRTTKLIRYATMCLWTSDNTVACHSSRSDKVLHVKHINITTCFKLIRFLQTSLKPQMNSQIVWIFGLRRVSWEPHWQSWPQLTQIVISIQHDEAWKPEGTTFFTIAFQLFIFFIALVLNCNCTFTQMLYIRSSVLHYISRFSMLNTTNNNIFINQF